MPISPIAGQHRFRFFFTDAITLLGKEGLSVTADVYRDTTLIQDGVAAFPIGRGLYGYDLPTVDNDAFGVYSALGYSNSIATTAPVVTAARETSEWADELARTNDAAILGSAASPYIAFDAVTLSLTIPVLDVSAHAAGRVFTAKVSPNDADSAAIITIWEGAAGLTVLSGAVPAPPIVASDGSLAFSGTDAVVTLSARAMAGIGRGSAQGAHFDIQAFDAADPVGKIVAAFGKLKICSSQQQGLVVT